MLSRMIRDEERRDAEAREAHDRDHPVHECAPAGAGDVSEQQAQCDAQHRGHRREDEGVAPCLDQQVGDLAPALQGVPQVAAECLDQPRDVPDRQRVVEPEAVADRRPLRRSGVLGHQSCFRVAGQDRHQQEDDDRDADQDRDCEPDATHGQSQHDQPTTEIVVKSTHHDCGCT
jgi:hypothetical protein